jgi:hypothetical protein
MFPHLPKAGSPEDADDSHLFQVCVTGSVTYCGVCDHGRANSITCWGTCVMRYNKSPYM